MERDILCEELTGAQASSLALIGSGADNKRSLQARRLRSSRLTTIFRAV